MYSTIPLNYQLPIINYINIYIKIKKVMPGLHYYEKFHRQSSTTSEIDANIYLSVICAIFNSWAIDKSAMSLAPT